MTEPVPPKRKAGRPFGSKNKANPLGGAVPHAQLMRQVRRLTKAEIAETGSMLLLYTKDELKAMAEDSKTTMLRTMLAAMILQSHKNPVAFEKLLDRIVGKVKEKIEVENTGRVPNRYAALSQEELEKKRIENAKLLEGMQAPIIELAPVKDEPRT